jgi:phospholipase C
MITRRQALRGLGLGVGALAAGPGCFLDVPRSCAPPSSAGPDTIVVLMEENRSFDSYFGALALDRAYPAAASIDGLTGEESNPDSRGGRVPVFHQTSLVTADPPHDWDSAHLQFDGGRNDGFVRAIGDRPDPMGYYTRDELPFYYRLADEYTVCDRWFSSVMGPTWPNRYYLHCATSRGKKDNVPFYEGGPPTIWEQLARACRSYRNYSAASIPWYVGAFVGRALSGADALTPVPIEEFFRDALAGTLPNFALIDPDFHVNDDHPPSSVAMAQAFVATIYQALAQSPQWPRCLFVIVYDEHGGFYDHVAPSMTADDDAQFRQLGFRVPALAIGPTVRRGAVCSTTLEHVSIARTLATRFGIASLGARMDAANDLSSCLDVALAERPRQPARVPRVELSLRAARAPRSSSQPELEALARAARIPRHRIDPRSAEGRLASWLRQAQALDAVAVVA